MVPSAVHQGQGGSRASAFGANLPAMRRIALLLLACGLLAPWHARAGEPAYPHPDRTLAYEQFRAAFDAQDYLAALPQAGRLVELTSTQFGERSVELATPLTNLATTFYRMEQHGEALGVYQRAMRLIEEHTAPTDERRVPAMHGLAFTLRAMQRHAEAITVLEPLIDLVRVREGLDSPVQFPLLRALIDSYDNNRQAGIARELRMQAFHIAERAYGIDDERMIGPLCELAEWHVRTARYSGARLLYLRAVQIADRVQPGNLAAVEPLRGLARAQMYRRLGSTEFSIAYTLAELPRSVVRARLTGLMFAPPDEDERALRDALQRLQAAGPDRARERGEVLVELGDLLRITGQEAEAMQAWSQAWEQLQLAGDTRLLERPAALLDGRIPHFGSPPYATPQQVLVRLSLSSGGEVRQAVLLEPAVVKGMVARRIVSGVRDSMWRPAFRAGAPVANQTVLFSLTMLLPKRAVQRGE